MSARGASSSKKKKAKEVELSAEMEECQQALQSLMTKEDAGAFNEPVDWEALGIPEYPDIIKNPMDLATIQVRMRARCVRVACAM